MEYINNNESYILVVWPCTSSCSTLLGVCNGLWSTQTCFPKHESEHNINTEKKMQCQIHPVHESELWFPAVLISLSKPSTASPRCEGDISPSKSSTLGPMLVSLSCSRRMTVAGGLLSCIGDPRFLGGVRCACFFVRGWTMLDESGEGRPGRSGVLWKGVEVKPAAPIRGVFICDDEDGKIVKCLRDERGGVERTESESRGHLRLWSSSWETRRSNWWSVTLRIALWSLERRRLAFYSIVRTACF
jgi:hypothetical protein